jgi:hypothetical protein
MSFLSLVVRFDSTKIGDIEMRKKYKVKRNVMCVYKRNI